MVEVISNDDDDPGYSLLVFGLVSLDVLNLVMILSTEDDDLHFHVGKHS